MPDQRPKGFPRRFPVRDDIGRTVRYRIVATTFRVLLRTWFGPRLRIEGRENVPRRGPLIIASNHLSNLDALILGSNTPGACAAMAKVELFHPAPVAWMLGGCNVFPVVRGTADRQALRTAIDVLGRGGRLLMFVEGTRAERPGMGRAEPGVGFLLRRQPALVVPVAITGTEASLVRGRLLPRRTRITVRFGPAEPLAFDAAAARSHQAVADAVAARVAALLPPEYRGHYAGADGAA